jgi:predicted RNase H-like HicB family nuclease
LGNNIRSQAGAWERAGSMNGNFTTIIEWEEDGYMAKCPELDIASQGDTIKEARYKLQEALELFFESASMTEIQDRLRQNYQA